MSATTESMQIIDPELARPHVTDDAQLGQFKAGEAIIMQTRSMRQVMRAMIAGDARFKNGITTKTGITYENPQAIHNAALELEETHKVEIALYHKVMRLIEKERAARVLAERNAPKVYRKDLPLPIPKRILALPVQDGYPIPWFVAQLDDGSYDFRFTDGKKFALAIRRKLCWVCGQKLGRTFAFAIGPMCIINRVTSEPPTHLDCAEWSAIACPFLTQKEVRRRTNDMPEGTEQPAGIHCERQPGAVALWVTDSFRVVPDGKGKYLVRLNRDPHTVIWFAHGRKATYDEAKAAVDSGVPILKEIGTKGVEDENEIAAINAQIEHSYNAALRLLP